MFGSHGNITNLHVGGATIDSALVTPFQPTVLSLKDQVTTLFLPHLASKPSFAPWTSTNSLFTFFIGINDVGNTYGSGKNLNTFYSQLFDVYFGLIEQVYLSPPGLDVSRGRTSYSGSLNLRCRCTVRAEGTSSSSTYRPSTGRR